MGKEDSHHLFFPFLEPKGLLSLCSKNRFECLSHQNDDIYVMNATNNIVNVGNIDVQQENIIYDDKLLFDVNEVKYPKNCKMSRMFDTNFHIIDTKDIITPKKEDDYTNVCVRMREMKDKR